MRSSCRRRSRPSRPKMRPGSTREAAPSSATTSPNRLRSAVDERGSRGLRQLAAGSLSFAHGSDRIRLPPRIGPLCYTRARTASRPRRGAAAVRGPHPSEENCSMKIAVPRETADGRDPRRAHAPDRRPAGRRRRRGAGPGRRRRGLVEPRRRVSRGRATIVPDAPHSTAGRPGAARRAPLRRGGRDAAHGIGPHRHAGHAGQAGARPEAGGARRHRHQHGRHPAHHPGAVHGHPAPPGDGGRLQGRPHRRRAAAEVLALLTTAAGTVARRGAS